jgi:hypothetical protein
MSRPAENVVSRHDADLTKAIYARVPVADRDRFADCAPGMGATPARSLQPRQSLGRYAMHYLSWRRGGLYIAPMSSACVHGSTRVEELALPKYVESGNLSVTRPSSGGRRLNRSWSEALVRRNGNRSSFQTPYRRLQAVRTTDLSRRAVPL